MSDEENGGFVFVCPKCEEYLELNEGMKETLIERGCVICGTPVKEEAFTEESFADSS
jgi:transcription initiation factor IIE alpha subunit